MYPSPFLQYMVSAGGGGGATPTLWNYLHHRIDVRIGGCQAYEASLADILLDICICKICTVDVMNPCTSVLSLNLSFSTWKL